MSHGDSQGPESAQSSNSASNPLAESEYANSFGSTGPTVGTPNSRGADSQIPSDVNSNSPSQNVQLKVLGELEGAVDLFRGGKSSKTEAISSIIRILGENTDVSITSVQKEATFDSYLTEILAIQSSLEESSGSKNLEASSGDEPSGSKSAHVSKGNRRDRHCVESDDESDDGSPSKKLRLIESDMPWYIPDGESSNNSSSPSCQETCRLLRAFNRDISKAKFLVKIAPNAPSGVPSSQWERILKGEAVDLNQFFAALHLVVPDEERKGRLGDTEISFGVAEPKKRISTAAEWSSAWRRASKAISFAFPHRREELLEYGDYIESEFAAKITTSHHKLLLYDIALRNEVAAGQQSLLSDLPKFNRLYSAIVLPDGVESGSGRERLPGRKSRAQGSDKFEICNKFNAGTCKNHDSDCKYRHLCKNCRKPGHGVKDCPDGSK
jgi:hypothetical protein